MLVTTCEAILTHYHKVFGWFVYLKKVKARNEETRAKLSLASLPHQHNFQNDCFEATSVNLKAKYCGEYFAYCSSSSVKENLFRANSGLERRPAHKSSATCASPTSPCMWSPPSAPRSTWSASPPSPPPPSSSSSPPPGSHIFASSFVVAEAQQRECLSVGGW